MEVTAGEYGYDLPYFRDMLAAGAVDCLQADVTRCGGITAFLRVGALADAHCRDLSSHTAPQVSAHACAGLWHLRHLEYFADHIRVESLLFDGVLAPVGRGPAPRPRPARSRHRAQAPRRRTVPALSRAAPTEKARPDDTSPLASGPRHGRPGDPASDRLDETARLLARELSASIEGEVRFDDGSRAAYSTDSSNYRQVPIGVVVPRTIDDVIATVDACRRHGAPITSRGGGTSLAGQCTNVAVVIDFSKYLNRVCSIDPDDAARRRRARLQPRPPARAWRPSTA